MTRTRTLDDPDDSHGESAADRGATAESADRPVATVESVSHAFGDLTVLEDVSFPLSVGTVTALIGPNGCGKSTLLRIVAGLLSPTSGSVELAATSERPVGYLPQSPAFRPGFSVEETLTFYADLVDEDVDVGAVLERVGLHGVRDRTVTALSGGMVRLLGLAQATIGDPDVLVLDEPSSGLDPQVSEHIFEVIADLADGGAAVVLATHDLILVEEAADTVVLLDRRGIVSTGSIDEVTASAGAESLADAFSALVERNAEIAVRGGRDAGEGAPDGRDADESERDANEDDGGGRQDGETADRDEGRGSTPHGGAESTTGDVEESDGGGEESDDGGEAAAEEGGAETTTGTETAERDGSDRR
jgi:ABC-type multidrug transport system ATPase subunit